MKKKNVILFILFGLMMLLVASCNSEAAMEVVVEEDLPAAEVIIQESSSEEAVSEAGSAQDETTETLELSSTQLIVGSFLLEEAGMAISAEQAGQMVQLWKVYQSMMESNTAAEAEREALINQIAGVFTSEQQTFLAAADMGQESMQAIMADLGVEAQDMGRGGNPEGDGEKTERPEGGEEDVVGGRGGGGGQGGDMAGQEIDEEQQATMQAERAAAGGGVQAGGQNDTMLLPYLIEMLEAIV